MCYHCRHVGIKVNEIRVAEQMNEGWGGVGECQHSKQDSTSKQRDSGDESGLGCC